jgi:hypothetical protein
MYKRIASLVLALLVLVSVLSVVQPVKAEPTVNAVVPAVVKLDWIVSTTGSDSEWVNFTASLSQNMALTFTLISGSSVAKLLIDNRDYTSLATSKIVLKPGTHWIAINFTYSGAISGDIYINFNYNLTFPWTFKLDVFGYPYTSLTFKHGLSFGAYPGSSGVPPFIYKAEIDFKGNNVAYVTADKGVWTQSDTKAVGLIGSHSLPFADNIALTVGFVASPVSKSLVRIVDNYGSAVNKFPNEFSRILVGSTLTVQPLESNLTIIHLVNNTAVDGFKFDKATPYLWGVIAYRLYSREYVYPIINASTSTDYITPKRLNVKYQLVAPEQVPFSVKLRGDLTKVGIYPLDFIVNGVTVGTLTNTEKVYIDGTVSTIGTYTFTETSDTYNVSITYNVVVNGLTHPFVDKVYTFETASISTDKVYLTITTTKPFLLHSTRKVMRITGNSVGDINIGSNNDIYFAGVTTSDTYTVKLATKLLVKNLYDGKPISAKVTVYDAKGNIIAQASGQQVTFDLEPLNTYVAQGDNGAEKQSKTLYLNDDIEVIFTYSSAPAFTIPMDYVYLAFMAVIASAILYLVWKLRKGGITVEIQA